MIRQLRAGDRRLSHDFFRCPISSRSAAGASCLRSHRVNALRAQGKSHRQIAAAELAGADQGDRGGSRRSRASWGPVQLIGRRLRRLRRRVRFRPATRYAAGAA